ncbi:MAG: radical SAM family heme chaperone HemW [Gammaproteobacteria bacterium]|uniref:radical SAM family heme chaperone HemW n=1 Tax=Rhodoferax sp. TaxID=50421 RepID=UPI0018039866|nr:radical SAM family heme chaperone HemW [Rhodoferax sp.]MBU3898900.1 radical SAM family heme chaperone HemW [Gammaproteobacteria bacterium]MBA3059521.1 oxygen-independent coproporphyrinogen III oxidase-like protein [Rhodoferax sp.]MBU3999091.1 radical SAM family heme chaperone HemW [Gammaproteobacteria bacterium]MBU4019376.1 radical SAM family heme chaperone HemW [Gammaproteobacteria bacterium]MBU4081940.1 radical SAM family heme chaperone HemW [Gammaproteobacteria bacterium]
MIPVLAAAESGSAPRDIGHYLRPGLLQLAALPPLSLYVHLPWCLKKCPYCDFNSHEMRAAELPEQRYLDALMADLEAALPLIWGRTVHSIFIGGGTPSLFSPEGIDRLLGGIRARLRLEAACEITLEANPGTFEKDRFRAFRSAGVTRLSVGVQSFNDSFLKTLGRVHDGAQALAAVEEAAQAFDTFNLDLMYALPGQTLKDVKQDMALALTFKPPHISIYQLTIEPNTVFAKYPPPLPEDDTAYDMLDLITDLTGAAGLQRYEVSAYAAPGHRCFHNLNYWQFGDYLGIGAGAHSKLSFAHRVVRQVRYRDPGRYMEQALAGHCLAQDEEVSRANLPLEFMLNALRLKDGFALKLFSERTGLAITAIHAALEQAQAQGLIVRDLARVTPTVHGFDFLNDLQSLFLPPHT